MTTASAVASGIMIYLTATIKSVEFTLLLLVALVGTLAGVRYVYIRSTHVNIFEQANPIIVYPPHPKPVEDEDPQPPV